VNYPELDKDIVFNFGLFDFSTPHFYLKFIRGKLKYMLGIQYMDDFMEQFKWEGRSVKEQNLNLTEDQSKELLERLAFLYLPQNRYYYYSFLYKNCTSELRDIIFPLVEQSQELYEAESAGFTYRELLNNYIKGWTKFGINLILGSSLDKPANKYESMFLPENLYNGIAILKNGDLSIVSEDVYLYRAVEKEKRFSFAEIILSPLVVFLLLFAIMVFLVARSYTTRAKRRYNFYSNLYLGLLSILGLILTIIILITEHTELYSNYNLLWCNPLFLLVVLASLKRWKKAERLFSAISLIFLSLLQFVWACNIQYAEPGFIPIIITLALLFITRIIFSKA